MCISSKTDGLEIVYPMVGGAPSAVLLSSPLERDNRAEGRTCQGKTYSNIEDLYIEYENQVCYIGFQNYDRLILQDFLMHGQ